MFDIDAETAGLKRLVEETAELPQTTGFCRAKSTILYSYQPIGTGQYLVPLTTQFDMILPDAGEDHSAMVFSGCHEYAAESTLAFGTEDAPASAPSGQPNGARNSAGTVRSAETDRRHRYQHRSRG